MMNPFQEVDWRPNRTALRSFGKSWVVGFPTLAAIWLLAGRFQTGDWRPQIPLLLASSGGGAGILFLLFPAVGKPFYFVWYALTCSIGIVVGNLALSIVFWVFVTGIGVVKRAIGKPVICRRPDPKANSYWLAAPPAPKPARYFRQF